jgi:hypothetical protein
LGFDTPGLVLRQVQEPVHGDRWHANAPHASAAADVTCISAMKMAEWLGVAYQTAWHLGHRIRAMMAEDNPVLRGLVELDEIYAGVLPRKRAKPAHDLRAPRRLRPTSRGVAPGARWCWWLPRAVARSMPVSSRRTEKPRLPRRDKESWQRTPW